MAGVKITKFLGKAPKQAPEILPETAAQVARNCKLYAGNLIPYPTPNIVDSAVRASGIRTLYALRDPDTNALRWLSWTSDVDIAVATATTREEQRFYYSGDGAPKVSNYRLATTGTAPYPVTYYDLGLPIPEDDAKLITTYTDYVTLPVSTYSRDSGNVVTIKTLVPHRLRSGNYVTITGFTYVEGTYVQEKQANKTGTSVLPENSNLISVTITDHGLTTGTLVNLEFSPNSGMNGTFTAYVVDEDRFSVNSSIVPNNGANNDTVTWTNVGSRNINITIPNHGLANGATVTLDFVSGNGVDGNYTIFNVTPDTFDVAAPILATTSGSIRWDIRNVNAYNVECTVQDDYTFTYYSPGPAVAETPWWFGRIDLGGLTQARSYVYTWVTPWLEESIASEPSDTIYIKEGTEVALSNIPSAKPVGNNFIRGVRIYRTLASSSGTEYFRLKTLWFPTPLESVSRTSNVASVTTQYPHNLGIGDRFHIANCSIGGFTVADLKVTAIPDEYTFQFAQTGTNIPVTAATGTLYCDASEDPSTDDPIYWGLFTYDFDDNFESTSLLDILESDNYDPPPPTLQGLTAVHNNILVGFVDNKLYFSEPAKPHAWPPEYAITVEYPIVGVAAISGNILVLTNSYPYIVTGTDPAAGMNVSRIDAQYPCLNKRSIVTINSVVIYATHDGLASYSPGSIPQLISKTAYESDTWYADLDPTTLIAAQCGDTTYFASHSGGSILFDKEDGSTSPFVDCDTTFTAAWYDSENNKLYYTADGTSDLYLWNDLTQPYMIQQWKSKVMKTTDMLNLGAARVIADYGGSASPLDWTDPDATWGDPVIDWTMPQPLTFRFWADKEMIYETELTGGYTFRLPTGYRTDTFEVEVEGNIRVREIHLAETPLGLKEV